MDRDQTEAPAHWREEPARSDDDIARGDVVPASVVHDRLRTAIEMAMIELTPTSGDSGLPTKPRHGRRRPTTHDFASGTEARRGSSAFAEDDD